MQETTLTFADELVGKISRLADIENRLIVGDCLDVLPHLPSDSVDLIHTSPPYNIDRPYKGQQGDRQSVDVYLAFLSDVIRECKRVLKPNASLFWQTGYTQVAGSVNGDILPLDIVTYDHFHGGPEPLVLWDRIIWRYFGGMAFKRKFTNRHETVLWYVKPDKGVATPFFDVDSIRERTREHDKRNNFWGRNPGNVWEIDRVAFGASTQSSHIAVFPEEVTERIVRACCVPGGLVLDPFSGSGTTAKVARGLGRKWIGIEVVDDYARESSVRLGYQQPSEIQALASAIVKSEIFGGRRGSMSLATAARQLSWWINGVDVARLRAGFDKLVTGVIEDDSPSKIAKRRAWETLDRWIDELPARDPAVIVDKLLLTDYRLRLAWNGASRYRSALEILEGLCGFVKSLEGALDQFMLDIASNEPSSYRLLGDQIELVEPAKRLKERVRDVHAPAPSRVADGEEEAGQTNQARFPI